MADTFCPSRKDEQYRELADVLGSPEMAHLVWDRNGGHALDFDPKGQKSTLFEQLLDYTDNDRFATIRLKAQYYLEEATNALGVWYENFTVEPVLENRRVELTDTNNKYFTMLDRLSAKFGYTWDFAKEGEIPEGYEATIRLSGKNPVIVVKRGVSEFGDIIHEFGHIFIEHIKRDNPKLWDNLQKEFEKLPIEEKNFYITQFIRAYPDHTAKAVTAEMFTYFLEKHAAKTIDENTGLYKAITDIWEYIKQFISDTLGIEISKIKPTTSIQELADMMMNPDIKLEMGDKFGSGEFYESYSGDYSFNIPFKKKVTDIEVPVPLTKKDIVTKLKEHSKDVLLEEDPELAKKYGHYYWKADDGKKHYLTGVTRRMAKYGYGFSGEDDPTNVHIRRGKLIHGEIDNIQAEIMKDLSAEYGMKLSDRAKKELAEIFKTLKGKHTAITELPIMDKKSGLVGKPDLILISEDGKVMIFEFKTKFRKYITDRDGVKKLKRSSFDYWNKPYNNIGYSDKDKAHLQVSIYGHMIEKVLGIPVTSINAVKLDAVTEDEKVITSIEAYSQSEDIIYESYFNKRNTVNFHHATEGVYYGDEASLHNKRLENLERERNDQEEEAFVRLSAGSESLSGTILQKLKVDLRNRLQVAKKRYDYDKRVRLENVMTLVEEEESPSNAIAEIIQYSYEEVMEVVDIVNEFINEKKNFTPGLLYRWSDSVQAYKNLKIIKDALYDNPELIPGKQYVMALDAVLDQIGRLEALYKTEGRYLIAKWLTPYYNGIKVKFEDTYKSEYRKLKYRLVKKGKQTLDQFEADHGTIYDYANKRMNSATVEKDTFNLLYKELEIASRDVSELTRWIDNMLDTSDPVAAALVNAFTQAEEKSRLEAIDKREDMFEMLEELQLKNSRNMNTSSEKFYAFMLEHDKDGKETQFILRPYKSDFFADVEAERKKEREGHSKAETNAAVSEFRKTLRTFDDDTFREAMTDKLKEMYEANEITKEEFTYIYEELATSETFWITNLNKEKVREEVISNLSYWNRKNSPLFYTYDQKYINPEWEKFMDLLGIDKKMSMYKQMQAVRKSDNIFARYYTFIEEVSREANQMIPFGYRIYDRLPGVGKMNSERFKAGMNPLTMVKENLKGDFFIRPDDLERGNQEYTNEFGRTRYYIPIHYTNKIEPEDQSYDISGIYFKFWESANDFRNKREILPELEMTRFFINSRQAYKRNVFSDILRKNQAGDDDHVAALKDTTVLSAMFNDWFEMALYGKMSKDLKDPIKINDNLAFDPMKFVDAINRYTSLNLLGLNVVQGFANIALGEIMQGIETIAHEYVDAKSYAKALVKYDVYLPGVIADIGKARPTSFGGLLYQEFNVLSNKATDVTFSRNTKFGNMYDNSSAFAMQKSGEHWLQNRFLLAMMMQKQMVDLNGKSIGTLLDQYVKVGNKIQLKQQAEMTAEEFQKFLKKNNWTEADQNAFKIKVKGILSRMHGEYSDLGRVAIQRLALGRMAYMFRKFVVPGFRRRWGTRAYSERLGQYTEGNYITFLKFFRNYYKEIFGLKFAIMGENWAGLSDHEKANIRRTISEAAFLTAAIILAGVAYNMKDGGDDDEWFWSFMAYQAYRLKTEMLFFVSPGNAMQILRSPMASMSVIENVSDLAKQLTNPTEIYQRGPMKGEYKLKKNFIDLIPFYKQFYRLRDIEQQIQWFRSV